MVENKKSVFKRPGLWLAIFLIAAFVSYEQANRSSSNSTPSLPIAETCEQVSSMFGSSSNLTDIQKPKEWQKKFWYRQFEWDLVVQDVINDGNDFTIITKCQNSNSLVGDVYIKVSWVAKNFVNNIHKGETRRFSGALKDYNIFGLQAQSFEKE